MAIEDKNGRKIRIAHLQLLPLLSGVQRVTLDEVTRLDQKLFEPFVICKEEGPFTEALKKAGVPYACVPELVREISPIQDIKALFRLKDLFQEKKFDIIHTHSSKTGILGRLAGRLAGVPFVMHTVHGYAFPAAHGPLQAAFYFLMEWFGARITDALVLLNSHDLGIAYKHLRMPENKLHLIPNGVNVEQYAPLPTEQRTQIRKEVFGVGPEEIVIGMVGRLWKQKNPEGFVQAAIQLLKDGRTSARFFLIGDGDEKEKLESLIQSNGFTKEIHILGWRDDVARLLGGLDIFVLPSRWEGMPLAALEAMAVGLPVVLSQIPGNQDLVENGIDGYLFDLAQNGDLTSKLDRLLKDQPKRIALGSAGHRKVKKDHSLKKRLKIIQDIYSRSLRSTRIE